jgi:hypothetical protein
MLGGRGENGRLSLSVVEIRHYIRGVYMFKSGKSGNPRGRPKGSYGGRMLALKKLDKIMARAKNQERLEMAIEEEFLADPMKFFKSVIMPLLPKESKMALDQSGIIEWRSLLELDETPGKEPDKDPEAG